MTGRHFDPEDYPVTPSALGLWYWHSQSPQVARWKIGGDEELLEGTQLRDAAQIRHAPCLNQFVGERYEAKMKRLIANRAGCFIDFEPDGDHAEKLFESAPTPKDLDSLSGYVPVDDEQTYDKTRLALAWATGLAREVGSETEPVVIWQPPLEGHIGAFPVEKSAADLLVVWPLQGSAVRVRTIDLKSTKLAPRDEKRTGQIMQTAAYAELVAPILESLPVPYELEVGVWTREDEPGATADLTPAELPKTKMGLDPLARQLREDLAPDGPLAEALAADSVADLPLRSPTNMSGALIELFTLQAWDRDSPWPTLLLTGLDHNTCERLADEYGITSLEDLAELLPPPETYLDDRDRDLEVWQNPLPWTNTTGQALEEDTNISANVRKAALQAQVLLGVVDPSHTHAYEDSHDEIYDSWAWQPGSGKAPLPSVMSNRDGGPAMDEDAVRVYLHVGTDDLHKRPWGVTARISRGSDPDKNVAVLVETATDWYQGEPSDADIEQDLLERAASGLLEAIQGVAGADQAYVHFYVYERRERERLIEALERHQNVTQPVDALRHLLGSEPGAEQRMVTALEPIIQRQTALPTVHTGLRNVMGHINPTPNLPLNDVWRDIPTGPDWTYTRWGESIDLKETFNRQFFDVFVPATRDGHFRPLVFDEDKDGSGDWIPSQDAWLTPVPRYGAQLPTEYVHAALGRFDMSRSRAPIADAADEGLLAGSLHWWQGAIPDTSVGMSKAGLSAETRRSHLPDIEMADIHAMLGGITTELHQLERALSWGVADDFVPKQPIQVEQIEQYRVGHQVDTDARVVTQNLLGAAYIEQQSSLDEFRRRYANATARDVALSGEGIPVTVSGIESVDWTLKEGPDNDDIAVPEELRIRCDIAFHDPELDLLAPEEVARRCKFTTDDDDVGTDPFMIAVPTEDDWEYSNSHRYLRHQPQLTLVEMEVDDTGRGEAVLEWQRRNRYAGSEPFTFGHNNFDTPPSVESEHPDAVVGADDGEPRCVISVGSQFLLVKTPDNYIGQKVRNRLTALETGDDPFIDFLERTLGWRDHLASRLTDALAAAARKHGLDVTGALSRIEAMDEDDYTNLMSALNADGRADAAVLAEHLDDVGTDPSAGDGASGAGADARPDGGDTSGGESE